MLELQRAFLTDGRRWVGVYGGPWNVGELVKNSLCIAPPPDAPIQASSNGTD